MTSVEIPVSIAAALPNLTVLDITSDVQRVVGKAGGSGIAYVSPSGDPSLGGVTVDQITNGAIVPVTTVTPPLSLAKAALG